MCVNYSEDVLTSMEGWPKEQHGRVSRIICFGCSCMPHQVIYSKACYDTYYPQSLVMIHPLLTIFILGTNQ